MVDIQTVTNAGMGLVCVRWSTYMIATIPGCVLWALSYGFSTLAVFAVAIRVAAGSPWGWTDLALIIALIAVGIVWGRRKHRAVDAVLVSDEA